MLSFTHGGLELFPRIESLWEGLRAHHTDVSPYFSEDFSRITFAARAEAIAAHDAKVRADIATVHGADAGYIIASITQDGIGEIDSLFVLPGHRKLGIAGALTERAIAWFDEESITRQIVTVATGNEDVLPFYARFGFYPRTIILKRKQP